jgi:branched-chain amino acid transport system substrate-binding protein
VRQTLRRAVDDLGRDRGNELMTGLSLMTEDFGLIAGRAAEGMLFLGLADLRRNAEVAPVVERFRASGYEPNGFTLYTYGAVQVWAQAAEKAGSLELPAMIASLREHHFDTVLGPTPSTTRATSRCKIR